MATIKLTRACYVIHS